MNPIYNNKYLKNGRTSILVKHFIDHLHFHKLYVISVRPNCTTIKVKQTVEIANKGSQNRRERDQKRFSTTTNVLLWWLTYDTVYNKRGTPADVGHLASPMTLAL